MKLFPPGPISLGMAEAVLQEVVQDPKAGVFARYGLTPVKTNEFIDRVGGLRRWLGHRYEPIPGIWSSYVVPEDRDEIEFVIGVKPERGRHMVKACKALDARSESVVSPLMLRTLALGYLAKAGV
jgi:hypothetical protein